ncbi:hypothetical protein FHS18_004666 [Paenibacillus phyllosphaerae]|uniref:Uncharacterized protein n=1 Tax=Paenibacillus phyllosphaerae TaxID=274593 RepID=A0A7W5B177_9BACL|nr:hypothetical protein [Paenibacillus phyllosphaerae]MBB3112565.1 hypothetical protein [Paenibacillus phyllosphaerae]
MLNEEYVAYKLWEYERKEVDRKLELRRQAFGMEKPKRRSFLLLTALFRSMFSTYHF